MKYKINDRVRIKSFDWYNKHTNGTEVDCGEYPFTSDMKEFCGQERIIANVCQECYFLLGIDDKFAWTDEMIEGLVEETITTNEQPFKPSNISLEKEMEWNLPNGYIFKDENGNVINTTKIIMEKKKKEYPKTYEECIGKLPINWDGKVEGYKHNLLATLQKLLICRDAYWKIAGEEMGLDGPWEPQECVIYYYMPNTIHYIRLMFPFPTTEMRDAFKENFDKDLEFCKKLL